MPPRDRNSPAMAHQISPQTSLIEPISTDSHGDVSHFGFPVGIGVHFLTMPILSSSMATRYPSMFSTWTFPPHQRRDIGAQGAVAMLEP